MDENLGSHMRIRKTRQERPHGLQSSNTNTPSSFDFTFISFINIVLLPPTLDRIGYDTTPPPHDDQRAWDTLEPEFGAGNHVEVEHLSPSRRYNHQFWSDTLGDGVFYYCHSSMSQEHLWLNIVYSIAPTTKHSLILS